MILREDGDGVICVGQPAHAWVSGQLARAWGNERVGAFAPREEVCLAAAQHDLGMAAWDAEPELDPETGWPRGFLEMRLERHLELWSRAPVLARSQSRYAALLVSLHGTTLYGRRNLDREPAEAAAAIRAYLEGQRRLQDGLRESLAADPDYAEHATPAAVDRNRRLLFTWDGISLALCMGRFPWTLREVPLAGDGVAELTVTGDGSRAGVDPWPFAADAVRVRCDGRRLDRRFDDEEAMRGALARAPWRTLTFDLVAARDR